MIFGLALSVGAITLVGKPPTTVPGLYEDILLFGFSFAILISVWMRYSRIMSVLPLENRRTISLNTLLLFTVSLEPFLYNLLNENSSSSSPTFFNAIAIAYGTDLGILMLILGFFTALLVNEEKKLIPKDLVKEYTYDAISYYFSAALFLLSPLIPLSIPGIGFQLRFDFWILPLIIAPIRRFSMNAISETRKARSRAKLTGS